MKTYISETGYIKRIETGECYEAKTLYLGMFDSPINYIDIEKEEYLAYVESERKKYENLSI